jgi:hypothetical protein
MSSGKQTCVPAFENQVLATATSLVARASSNTPDRENFILYLDCQSGIRRDCKFKVNLKEHGFGFELVVEDRSLLVWG